MRRFHPFAIIPLMTAFGAVPAHACIDMVDRKLEDVKYADLVVVGTIVNYRIVRDEVTRRRMVMNKKLSPELRRYYATYSTKLLTDYALFDVQVDTALYGKISRRIIPVTWDNSTYGEPPAMDAGPFLIAIRHRSSPIPPLRGASATILPAPGSVEYTVLQAPCAAAFIFKASSVEARQVRAILAGKRR